jgi:hypothetical protein
MKNTPIEYTFIYFSDSLKYMKKTPPEYTFIFFVGSLKLNEKYMTEHNFISLTCLLNHEGDTKNKKQNEKKEWGFLTIVLS